MEFEFPEEVKLLKNTVEEFVKREVEPLAREIEAREEIPTDLYNKMARMGLMGVVVPSDLRGAGMSTLSYIVAIEGIARACASLSTVMTAHNSLVCEPILNFGTEDQKKRFIIPLARGEFLGCFALTEPGAGSDVSSISTTAEKRDGGYILKGSKRFITNGRKAHLAIIFAATDKAKGRKGISAFLVERGTKGFEPGRIEDKMGQRGAEICELLLDGCYVPEENLLGREGDGFKIAMHTLDGGRIGIAAQAVGIAAGCFEEAVKYSKERVQFGEPICNHQAIQWMIADMATEIDAARLLTYRAALLKDEGKVYAKEASMAKLYATEAANRIAYKALQIHGGYGYIKDYPVERYYRDVRVTTIYEGTSEIQRLIIAREILKGVS